MYLGLVLGAALTGWAMCSFHAKTVLLASVFSNAAAVFLFGAAPNAAALFAGRFLIGFTQAPMFVYAPVWVDTYAPPSSQAKWMSLTQAFVALGIVTG